MTKAVNHKIVESYEIYGNQYVAIAVNREDATDSHYFTIDPEVNNDAFIRACGWAYEPPSEDEDETDDSLDTRREIFDFIATLRRNHKIDRREYDSSLHHFCFNVKCPDIDVSYDHLLELLWSPRISLRGNLIDSRVWHQRLAENLIFEWGREAACAAFVGDNGSGETNSYSKLPDGTPIKVKFSFEGRSGGWLSINSFEGHDLTDLDFCLSDMSIVTLRKFYALIKVLLVDLSNPRKMVEKAAAETFFENYRHIQGE
jgi:hypothetical protein